MLIYLLYLETHTMSRGGSGGFLEKFFILYTLANPILYRLALWDSFKTTPPPPTGLGTGSLLKFDLKSSASLTLKVLCDPENVVLHVDPSCLWDRHP
mgnify:CR=1 FL=1